MPILNPIDPNNICGSDFKYDDLYLSIEVEIEKDFNATNEEDIKWDFVIQKCEEILTKNSKDLKLAAYWLYGLWKKNGWNDFFSKMDVFASFLESFGKELYPKSQKRKVKIFEWLDNIFESHFLAIIDQLSEAELVRLEEILHKLNYAIPKSTENDLKILQEVYNSTIDRIHNIEYQKEEKAREEQRQKDEEESQQLITAAEKEKRELRRSEEQEILDNLSTTSIEDISFDKIHDLDYESIESFIDPMIDIINENIEISPVDYFSIKPLLFLGEILLEKALSDEDIIRDDFIPSEDICNASRNIIENGSVIFKHISILEKQLVVRPTWLEGYYILSQLLYKLDQSNHARKIEENILHFIHRRRELLEMEIGERTLIDGKMLAWVNIKLSALGDNKDTTAKYKIAHQEALTVKNEKGTTEALEFLDRNYRSATSEEERFRWRLLFSEFALELGNKKLALSLLLELEKTIQEYSLDKWQPELAINTYEILLKPIMIQELGGDAKERIYQKLSILDMQKVINI